MPRLDRKSYYRRKTIPAWKHSAIVVLLSTVTLAVIAGWLDEKFTQVMASPLSQKEYVTVEKVVEKKVFETPITIEDKIRATFPEDPENAVKIARCESGLKEKAFNPANTNGTTDSGIFQINSVHGVAKHILMDSDVNIAVARVIYERAGNSWRPWVCAVKLGII